MLSLPRFLIFFIISSFLPFTDFAVFVITVRRKDEALIVIGIVLVRALIVQGEFTSISVRDPHLSRIVTLAHTEIGASSHIIHGHSGLASTNSSSISVKVSTVFFPSALHLLGFFSPVLWTLVNTLISISEGPLRRIVSSTTSEWRIFRALFTLKHKARLTRDAVNLLVFITKIGHIISAH
jgi:hypothetical protein